MARPIKKGVDFIPHDVKSGRTIYTLESLYGNDGYAFWFKLLELLGEAEEHVYDCRLAVSWRYLLAKTKVGEDRANEILNLLAELEAIDPELWQQRIVWCPNLVKRLSEVYRKRNTTPPLRPPVPGKKKPPRQPAAPDEPPGPPPPKATPPEKSFEQFWSAYPRKEAKKAALKVWLRLKPSDELVQTILAAVELAKCSRQWQNRQYIPLPATYLNNDRWEDTITDLVKPTQEADDLDFLQ